MRGSPEKTTLFLRGMPVPIVREAKAAAARRGSTLAKYVADTLERSLALADDAPPDGEISEFERSVAWYGENRDRLLGKYGGEYVAIGGSKVLDHDEDFEALASRVFRRLGTGAVYMPRVEGRDRPLRLRSPRRSPA